MKKLAALLLALIMVFSFVSCDESTTPSSGSNGENSAQSETKKEITFTEAVAVDNAECSIKITGIDPNNYMGFTLKAQLENKSAEKTYMFSIEKASVNGVQTSPLFASEVAAGKKSNDTISFMDDDELKENGVGDFTDIELTFRVYDSNDWMADEVARETVHIYPYGEDKAVNFVREAKDSDNVIVDNESVTVIVTGYEEDTFYGYSVNMFLLNKTDKEIMFTANEVSVNGFMVDPLFANSVSGGKCAFASMTWFDTTFEENGITDVEEIEFILRAYDYNNWSADFANETITLNP